MLHGNGQFAVPPGFRFHPTDEELLYYYLRKKVTYEAIDLDVIRDVDLNKLEPWDLKDKCRIGTGPQNEWYFFSHKDKKYPTGSRTNRATTAGFWKATGRDKAIHLSSSSKRIGMRKTLVFYTGRAPHGHKTDWIMHEYRLDDDGSHELQEEGWVVCRVFKKKNINNGSNNTQGIYQGNQLNLFRASESMQSYQPPLDGQFSFDNTMHLPQLLSSEPLAAFIPPPPSMNAIDLECSQNLMKLTSACGGHSDGFFPPERPVAGDWSILDKLLASNQNQLDQLFHGKCSSTPPQLMDQMGFSAQRLPLQYPGCSEADLLKFSKHG